MDVTASLDLACLPDVLFAAVDDLGEYPDWLGIVTRAEPTAPADGDAGPAWDVELRGRFGPLARSKQLRMVRVVHEAPTRVRFERRELDGREHSPWRLEGDIVTTPLGAALEMRLHYGGSFAGGLIERVLTEEIERSRPRLAAKVLATS